MAKSREQADALRKKWYILSEGDDLPPPIKSFRDMRFPPAVLAAGRRVAPRLHPGHALELVAPACAGCARADFAPFGASECARAHVPRAPLAALNATWTLSLIHI